MRDETVKTAAKLLVGMALVAMIALVAFVLMAEIVWRLASADPQVQAAAILVFGSLATVGLRAVLPPRRST